MADFGHAGRKISRLQRAHSLQGEFSPADHHPPATQRTRPGTKLSRHPRPQGQTGTKLSPHSKKHLFQPIRGEQGENYPGPDANNPSRENLFPQTTTHHPRSAHAPVQNSPSTAKNAHFSPSSASRENFFPVQTQTTRAGRIFSRRPPPTTHAAHTPRYKTLPAQQKTPISAHLARAGRTFSRSRRKQPEQGESFPADHHPPATQRTPTVQNSPSIPHLKAKPAQNSPSNPDLKAKPVQNSPSTAKNTQFGPFNASREKIIPVQTQTTRAGRIFSRRPPLTSHAAHTHGTKFSPQPPPQGRNRYKTLRAIPASRPTGTKLSPHSPTRTRTLKVACNSITARIRAYSKALESQGSVITARRTHWGIACETAEAPERRRTKRGRWSFTGPASYLSVLSAQTRATIRRARSARSPSSGRCGAGDARRR